MHTKFVIVGSARTGSSYITDSLLAHDDVLMHGEPFQKHNLDWHIREVVRSQIDLSSRECDPIGFFDQLMRLSAGRAFVGAKILYGQCDEALYAACRNPDYKKIFIFRPNLLANYSSFLLAQKTNVWNFQWELDRGKVTVPFEPEEFRKFVNWQRGQEFKLEKIRESDSDGWLTVSYSPDKMDERVDEVIAFLGLDPKRMTRSEFKRLNTHVTLDRFDNPEVVEATLQELGHPEWREE
jgi:hypothetical protein